ncbi:hypothetical protein QVD99_006080 [Batrachochytrium dendrobatidis]|nr:hypothetical protein QVD99_006080 [Batrachochytrium dendrobatidis]
MSNTLYSPVSASSSDKRLFLRPSQPILYSSNSTASISASPIFDPPRKRQSHYGTRRNSGLTNPLPVHAFHSQQKPLQSNDHSLSDTQRFSIDHFGTSATYHQTMTDKECYYRNERLDYGNVMSVTAESVDYNNSSDTIHRQPLSRSRSTLGQAKLFASTVINGIGKRLSIIPHRSISAGENLNGCGYTNAATTDPTTARTNRNSFGNFAEQYSSHSNPYVAKNHLRAASSPDLVTARAAFDDGVHSSSWNASLAVRPQVVDHHQPHNHAHQDNDKVDNQFSNHCNYNRTSMSVEPDYPTLTVTSNSSSLHPVSNIQPFTQAYTQPEMPTSRNSLDTSLLHSNHGRRHASTSARISIDGNNNNTRSFSLGNKSATAPTSSGSRAWNFLKSFGSSSKLPQKLGFSSDHAGDRTADMHGSQSSLSTVPEDRQQNHCSGVNHHRLHTMDASVLTAMDMHASANSSPTLSFSSTGKAKTSLPHSVPNVVHTTTTPTSPVATAMSLRSDSIEGSVASTSSTLLATPTHLVHTITPSSTPNAALKSRKFNTPKLQLNLTPGSPVLPSPVETENIGLKREIEELRESLRREILGRSLVQHELDSAIEQLVITTNENIFVQEYLETKAKYIAIQARVLSLEQRCNHANYGCGCVNSPMSVSHSVNSPISNQICASNNSPNPVPFSLGSSTDKRNSTCSACVEYNLQGSSNGIPVHCGCPPVRHARSRKAKISGGKRHGNSNVGTICSTNGCTSNHCCSNITICSCGNHPCKPRTGSSSSESSSTVNSDTTVNALSSTCHLHRCNAHLQNHCHLPDCPCALHTTKQLSSPTAVPPCPLSCGRSHIQSARKRAGWQSSIFFPSSSATAVTASSSAPTLPIAHAPISTIAVQPHSNGTESLSHLSKCPPTPSTNMRHKHSFSLSSYKLSKLMLAHPSSPETCDGDASDVSTVKGGSSSKSKNRSSCSEININAPLPSIVAGSTIYSSRSPQLTLIWPTT